MSHLALFTFIEIFSLPPHGTKMQAQMKYESFEHMSTTMKKESSHLKAKEQNGVACKLITKLYHIGKTQIMTNTSWPYERHVALSTTSLFVIILTIKLHQRLCKDASLEIKTLGSKGIFRDANESLRIWCLGMTIKFSDNLKAMSS